MGAVGRPPIPTRLKVLRGNPGRRPLNKKEPRAIVGKAEAPAWLRDPNAPVDPVEIYDALAALLVPLRVLTTADEQALADLADKIALHRRLRVDIYAGWSYETTTKEGSIMQRVKPEVAPFLDLSRQIATGLATFGLTPSSRSKIQTVGPEVKTGVEEFLGNGT